MVKTYEYDEGSRARNKLEEGMKALFQAPNDAVAETRKACKKRAKRSTSRRASRDSEADAQTS